MPLIKDKDGTVVMANRKMIRDTQNKRKGHGSHTRGNFTPKQKCALAGKKPPACYVNETCAKGSRDFPCEYRLPASK